MIHPRFCTIQAFPIKSPAVDHGRSLIVLIRFSGVIDCPRTLICMIGLYGGGEKSWTNNFVKFACEGSSKRKQDLFGAEIIIKLNRAVSHQGRVDSHKLVPADQKPRLTKRVLAPVQFEVRMVRARERCDSSKQQRLCAAPAFHDRTRARALSHNCPSARASRPVHLLKG